MVGMVLGLLASGEPQERILQADPYLEPANLNQALAYAAWRLEEREVELVTPPAYPRCCEQQRHPCVFRAGRHEAGAGDLCQPHPRALAGPL